MQKFLAQTELWVGVGALRSLKELGLKRLLIVTDRFFTEKARQIGAQSGADFRIFDGVLPDPPLTVVAEGVRILTDFAPEAVLALGGGSAMDCAKGILSLSGSAARLIAVPTTSGTGSEVTSFAILTHDGVKHPLVDEALRPSLAILDDDLLAALPKGLIADAGMDTVSHCLEAAVATNATPFTQALAAHALRTALQLLPRSFGGDLTSRGRLHCAATMAGFAFDNAGLGICHALAHALGGAFHLAHGRINGILLPHVLKFNAPAVDYAAFAALCGLSGAQGLRFAVQRLRTALRLPASLTAAGLEREALLKALPDLVRAALADPCCATNPRTATAEDLETILREAL